MTEWRRLRAKHLYRVVDDRAGTERHPLLAVSIHLGVVARSTITDDLPRADDLSDYKICRPGDLVLNRMRAFQGAIGISSSDGLVSPDYVVIRPVGSDARYLHHLFRSEWFVGEMIARLRGIGSASTGTVRTPRINAEDFGDIRVMVPPLSSQADIAQYLDAETARVDTLVAKKRQLMALAGVRVASSSRASLAECNGPRIPLKRRWRVVDCKHRTPDYLAEGYPVVSPGDATSGRLDLSRAHRFVGEVDYLDLSAPPRRPLRGSIIYSRNASIGIAAYVDTDELFCMGQDVCLITSLDQNQLFLTYVLNTLGVDQLDEAKIGSTFSRVNVAQILELVVPCPPREVQDELAQEFDRLVAWHQKTTAALTRQIELLQEHRQALITAAVTGELDIPGVAA